MALLARMFCRWFGCPTSIRAERMMDRAGRPAGREKAAARGVVVLREIILSRHRKVLGRNARSSDRDQAVHFALWAPLALASYLEAS